MVWSNPVNKPSSNYTNQNEWQAGYLLQEDFFFILQEDGSKIAIDLEFSYTNQTKPTGSFINKPTP